MTMTFVLSACTFAALLGVSAAGSCDGKDFACNHTDHRFTIEDVYMESNTKVHWTAGDTVHIKFSGHVNNFDVEAGTLHYKIWEFGVEHFRTAGALDYFVCGPAPKPCNKAHGKALHLAVPNDLNSKFIMSIAIKLPEKMQSGTMTLDLWGQDQNHIYDFTSSIRLSYAGALSNVQPAVRAKLPCDGPGFKCNHTDTELAITSVEIVSSSGARWKANDTVTITMQGHLKGHAITAGTLHYKIWEFGVEHFRTAGALDYFVCGPPPKPCDKTKARALHLVKPNSLNSGFTMRIRVPLPPALKSGTMTLNLWGEDQDHEPYDFTSEIRLSYTSAFSNYLPLSNVQPAVRATCDGPGFACNHTDTKLAITTVEIVSASGVRWEAEDTVTITMQGHLKGHAITAGTLHYKIWEFGVEHFRTAGALDYFVCGPPPKPCDKTKAKALHLTKPSSLNSGFTMRIRVPLPKAMKSGTMTLDLWGEDQDHEPYDFTSSIRLHYKS